MKIWDSSQASSKFRRASKNQQTWPKNSTHKFKPRFWPTKLTHKFVSLKWPTSLTYEFDPQDWPTRTILEFDTQEFPTTFTHTFKPWELLTRAIQPTRFSTFSIPYINNLFFLNYFRQFVECYIKSAIWNILHSCRPIRRKKLIRAGNKYHY